MEILRGMFSRPKSTTKKNTPTKISASNQLPLAITSSSFDSEAAKDGVIAALHDHQQQQGNAKIKKKWSSWKFLFRSNKLVINELLSQIDSLKLKQANDQLAIMKMKSIIEKFDQRIAELETKQSEAAVNNVVIVSEKKKSTSPTYDVFSDSDDDDSSMSSD